MFFSWMQLVCMLGAILIASLLFTNALEYLGERLGISEGVTGSVFAAIATALPETSIPLLALIAGTANHSFNEEVSVGAILGAPLMLSTLSTFILGLFAMKKRGLLGRMRPETQGLKHDLNFFLIAFLIGAGAMYAPLHPAFIRILLCISLILLYLIYILLVFRKSKDLVEDGHGVSPTEPLLITRLGVGNHLWSILLQLALSFLLLIVAAKGFIYSIETISTQFAFSPLLLSLLIIPIATELPEKVNSILWILKDKDTLAVGNITGAMVFQGTLLPALGILLTPWEPSRTVLTSIVITFLAALWLRLQTKKQGFFLPVLFVNGFLYLSYLYLSLS